MIKRSPNHSLSSRSIHHLNGLVLILSLFTSLSSMSYGKAILWKDSGSSKATETRFNYDRTEDAKKVSKFWSEHKVAVGMTAAGSYGLLGGVLAIHFHPQWNVDLGFGGGSHFQAYGFRIKKFLLLSSQLNPYIAGGFTRWHRNQTRPFNSSNISPGFIADQFLEETERQQGIIDEKLLNAALGLQYTFLDGPWKNYGIFFELMFLLSIDDSDSAPTGSLGVNYFF